MNDSNTNSDIKSSISTDEAELLEQLRANPLMAERFRQIMGRFEQEVSRGIDANQAETMAIEEVRLLGQSVLGQWAENTQPIAIDRARRDDPSLTGNGKKTPVALHLRNHLHSRSCPAQGETGCRASALPTSGGCDPARMLAATAAAHRRLRRRTQRAWSRGDLERRREAPGVPDEDAPVRRCWRYIKNREGQLDYQGAIGQGLPIGPGEVESAHRHLIQRRLKLAGAWWLKQNASDMAQLRVTRANLQWETLWQMKVA